MAFKGEIKRKNGGLKRGSPQKNLFKFCSAGICNNANNLPECQKAAFLTFRKFIFSGESMPLDPPLYYATRRQFYPTNMQKSIKHTKWKVLKQTQWAIFHFFWGGEGGSSQFICNTSGGGCSQKFLMKRGVIIYYRSYPLNPQGPLPHKK